MELLLLRTRNPKRLSVPCNGALELESHFLLLQKGLNYLKPIIIICIFLLFVMGCQSKEDNSIIKEVSSDSLTVRVKVEREEASKIKIHTELVNTGDNSIGIIHGDPLTGAVVGERSNRPDIIYSFVGISKSLAKNEVYSFDKDKMINITPEDQILYTETIFSINGERKTIELNINLDEVD